MNREVMERWCERGILALVLAILVYGPLALGGVRGLEFGVIQGLTAGVLVLWAIRLWLSPRPQLLWPPICWAVLAFTAYAIVRYFTADIEYVARHELLRVLVYCFLFFAIVNNLHRQETTQIITFTLLFLGMAISFYAFYQFITDSNYVWHFVTQYPHRASGTYICPNHLGGFLEMLLPLGLAYTLVGRLKPVTRVLLGYATLALATGIIATISRGSWLASSVAILLFFGVLLSHQKYRLPAFALLFLIALGGWLFFPRGIFVRQRLKALVTAQGKVDDDMRFTLWQPALQMWRDNPWFGVGPAHFDPRFRAYRPEGVQMSPDRAHNDYLNTLADWGCVGAALVVSAWVLLGVGVAKTWPSVKLSSGTLGGKSGSNKFALVLGASIGLIAILVHSFVDFNMHIPANAILAVTLMALLSSHLRFASDRYWVRAGIGRKLTASTLLAAAVLCLTYQGWRQATEWVWLDRAAKASSFSKQQLDLLRRAFAVEPANPQTAYSIGEAFRVQSAEGGQFYNGQEGVDYRQLANQAMSWFQRGMNLNKWDSRNYSGYGWCLDWLDRSAEAASYFNQAEELDPNNYYNLNYIGLHYIQLGDYAAAKPWFERSLCLEWQQNYIARNYLEIANKRLLEGATNEISAKLDFLH